MNTEILQNAYDPQRFQKEGHQLVDLLSHYLSSSMEATEAMTPWMKPDDQFSYWEKELDQTDDNLHDLFAKYLSKSLKLHHRYYMGHQVAVPAPDTALTSLLTNLLNNVSVVYEMGPAAVAMEHAVIKRVAHQMGFSNKSDGFMTSGGTLANLTALLAIRSIRSDHDVWLEGNKGVQYAILVSAEAHYSVEKAARVMGWGSEGIIKVPVGSDYKMRTELLPEMLQKARSEGKEVLGVIASSCSTSTGIYDDLNQIADFCEQEHLWMHVDAAHGGPAIFSEKYKHYLDGISRADSVAMDFHKMMMTPALASAIIFKKAGESYKAFAQKAPYLWEEPAEGEWFNLGQRSYECSKLMMGTKVFTLFKCYGNALFEAYIDRTYDMARTFAEMLKAEPRMELAIEPETNVICFRYVPEKPLSAPALSELNAHIRKTMLEKADFYMLQTCLKGQTYLRISIMNPFTQAEDLRKMMNQAIESGNQLITSQL